MTTMHPEVRRERRRLLSLVRQLHERWRRDARIPREAAAIGIAATDEVLKVLRVPPARRRSTRRKSK